MTCHVTNGSIGAIKAPIIKNTAKLKSIPSALVKSVKISPASLKIYPVAKPPIKTDIKPLPPNWSAISQLKMANASKASL